MKGSAARLLYLCSGLLLLLVGMADGRSRDAEMPEVTPFEAASLNEPSCCPRSPVEYCDFVFQGYEHTVPTFHLADGYNGDQVLSPVLASLFHWTGSLLQFSPGVKDSKTMQMVNVQGTNKNGTFLRCPIPYPSSVNSGNQFYIASGGGNVGKLWSRAFQRNTDTQHGLKFYKRRCILLPLTAAFFATSTGEVTSLAEGDGNATYPEQRRCVVFRTSS